MYEETLRRIEAQSEEDVAIAKKALLWVAHACRPLHMKELQQALAVQYDVGTLKIGTFDREGIPTGRTILAACCGLILEDGLGLCRLIREFHRIFAATFPSD